MKKFWLVWSEVGGAPTYKHDSENNARHEAARLSRVRPGTIFHVLELLDSCVMRDVVWANREEIPF